MSWFAELAGKAESLLNNLDEQTGAALRNHHVANKKIDKHEITSSVQPDTTNWGTKRRLPLRNLKKNGTVVPENKIIPGRKTSPMSNNHSQFQAKDISKIDPKTAKLRKSPSKKASLQYTLNNCPKTLVGDVRENDFIDSFGLKHRRNSLPTDLELQNGNDDWIYKLQNMEIENTMLKNELNVMNREMKELSDKLCRTEDGNDVDSEELTETKEKLKSTNRLKQRFIMEKESITSQMDKLKQKIQEHISKEVQCYKDQNIRLQEDIDILRSSNRDLEDKCRELFDKSTERDSAQIKLESDLRHAQSTVADLQSDLERSRGECVRLEKEWEAYKLRVKNMLHVKDIEIRSLQEGTELTVETQDLMAQIGKLKEERDELSEVTATVRRECDEMRARLQQVESSHTAAERVIGALRDALLEERTARNSAEGQCVALTKELRTLQMETGQTIASLRTALRDKDNELTILRDSSSNLRTTNTSALNVADYDVMQDTIENNKIQHLTQTLVQRQSKIDKLLADNNVLRIQLEKLESKYKAEVASLRPNHSHSVIHFQDSDYRYRSRTHASTDALSALSVRIGVMVKRYPIVRIFIIVYMVCLHLWVLTVLFTSTPETFVSRPSKS